MSSVPATILARVAIHNKSGIPKDDSVNDWVFDGPTHVATDFISAGSDALSAFYHTLGAFWGNGVKRTAPSFEIQVYDISGHLDGSPHGSPVETFVDPTGFTAPAANGMPNECAVVLSFTSTFYALALEHGPTATLPSTDAAVDQGAPVTHTGKTRPRARHRGRVYLGPLTVQPVTPDLNGNAVVSDAFIGDIIAAWTTMNTSTIAAGWRQSVWSRRDAAIYPVAGGWVDNRFDSQRRRQTAATVRTTF
jgi:hypothetical protein